MLSNSLLGFVTWPALEAVSNSLNGGKFWGSIKDSLTTKSGIANTIVGGLFIGLSSTLINALFGKYKTPTLVVHQTTTACPSPEHPAQPSPVVAATPAPEHPVSQPTTHTTTTVFADREQERRDAAPAQPSVA